MYIAAGKKETFSSLLSFNLRAASAAAAAGSGEAGELLLLLVKLEQGTGSHFLCHLPFSVHFALPN